MNRYEIKTEILVRSGRDTTSAWLSEAFLNDWINQEHRWAAGYKPWPYTQGRTQTTYTGVEELNFEGYKADSFRFMQIGGERLQKLNFEDYQIFKEEQPDSSDKVFSSFGGLVYVNPNCGCSGTLVAYGQYQPAVIPDGDGTDADEVETVFSPFGDEGNQAIIEKVLGNIANREGDVGTAVNKYQLAKALLEDLWRRCQDEKHTEHTKDRGQWTRLDVINGYQYDDALDTDQF
jgi:hypothetical protein